MKLIIRLLFLSLVAVGVLNFNLKTTNQVNLKTSEDFTPQWMALFTTLNRPPQMCTPPDQLRKNINSSLTNANKVDNGVEVLTPRAKPNKWARQYGSGPASYLFDYWDFLFQKDVATYFTNTFNAAKALAPPAPNVYDEPYSLDKMLYYYSQGSKGSLTGVSGQPADLAKQISEYNKNFNAAVWQNSISAGQIYQILLNWGWKGVFASNPAKRIVDMYDFDGDGRLNPSEFILFAIKNNESIFRLPECKQFCFEEIFKDKIDPLFRFMDCDQDGYINSENMWNVLTLLKRPNPSLYNMYNCIMPTVLNKGYRTISDNDFILKNSEKFDGFIDIGEFRAGVLLGYWDRQTDSNNIYTDDTKTLKNTRWSQDGTQDLVCQNILSLMPGGTPILPPSPPTNEPIQILTTVNKTNVVSPVNPAPIQPIQPVNPTPQQPQQNVVLNKVSQSLQNNVQNNQVNNNPAFRRRK